MVRNSLFSFGFIVTDMILGRLSLSSFCSEKWLKSPEVLTSIGDGSVSLFLSSDRIGQPMSTKYEDFDSDRNLVIALEQAVRKGLAVKMHKLSTLFATELAGVARLGGLRRGRV